MYKQIFDSKNNNDNNKMLASLRWGETENQLLSTLKNSKYPDIQKLIKLKVILSSANKDSMRAFLSNDGVSVLSHLINQRLLTAPQISESDVALLYEVNFLPPND
jgi:hypothetical protein